VNASATLNTNKGQEAFGVEAASNCGPLHLQPLSKDKSPQPGAPLAKLPICGSKIRRIFPNANYSDPPAALAACGQGRVAAKRKKWRGPAQRGGGRLCRLRVSLRAGCQSSTPARTYFGSQSQPPNGAKTGYQGRRPWLVSTPNAGSVLLPVRNRSFLRVWLPRWKRFEIGSYNRAPIGADAR
jgi:hypothetical protein